MVPPGFCMTVEGFDSPPPNSGWYDLLFVQVVCSTPFIASWFFQNSVWSSKANILVLIIVPEIYMCCFYEVRGQSPFYGKFCVPSLWSGWRRPSFCSAGFYSPCLQICEWWIIFFLHITHGLNFLIADGYVEGSDPISSIGVRMRLDNAIRWMMGIYLNALSRWQLRTWHF